MAEAQHSLTLTLDRLSRDLAELPEGSVLEALRADPELATWGWTDTRLSFWARQIAAHEHVTAALPGRIAD